MTKLKTAFLIPFVLITGCDGTKTNPFDFTSGGNKVDTFDMAQGLELAHALDEGFKKTYENLNNCFGVKIKLSDGYFLETKQKEIDDDLLNCFLVDKTSAVINLDASGLNKKLIDSSISLKISDVNSKLRMYKQEINGAKHNEAKLNVVDNELDVYLSNKKIYVDLTKTNVISSLAPIVEAFIALSPTLMDKLFSIVQNTWEITGLLGYLDDIESILNTSYLNPEYSKYFNDVGETFLGISEMQLAQEALSVNKYNDGHYEILARAKSELLNALLEEDNHYLERKGLNEHDVVSKKFYFGDDTDVSVVIKTNNDWTIKSIGISGAYTTVSSKEIVSYWDDGGIYAHYYDKTSINIKCNLSIDFNYKLKEVKFPDFTPYNEFPISLFL